jgi:hypothetical protein
MRFSNGKLAVIALVILATAPAELARRLSRALTGVLANGGTSRPGSQG